MPLRWLTFPLLLRTCDGPLCKAGTGEANQPLFAPVLGHRIELVDLAVADGFGGDPSALLGLELGRALQGWTTLTISNGNRSCVCVYLHMLA